MGDGTRRFADQLKWIHNPNKAYGSAISLGDANASLPIKVAERPMINVDATCALATGTIRAAEINYTQTVATTGPIEAFRVNIDTEVQTGSWANAIVGRIDYGAAGDARTGMAAAICAEVALPAMTTPGGQIFCFDAEIDAQASATVSSAHQTGFMNMAVWGDATAVTSFCTNGYLFSVQGIDAAGAGLIFDTCVATPASHALRICVLGTAYYILLTNNVDDT